MYVTGFGRCSGIAHTVVAYPKVAACAAFLGLAGIGGVHGWSSFSSGDADKVATYCQAPNEANLAVVPVELRGRVNDVCHCIKTECSTMQGPDYDGLDGILPTKKP